jgi:hypothetical protein
LRYLKPTYIAFAVIAAVLFLSSLKVKNPRVTSWDCFGYYLILPQTFIHGDPGNRDLAKIDAFAKKYDLTPTLYQVHPVDNGNFISQYPIGMAVFYFPAFVTGHLIAKSAGFEADGFSTPYQYSIIWFEFLYVLISFIFLRKILIYFFNELLAAALMLICFFGTNYFITVTSSMGMPHQYLFMLYVLLIYYTIQWTNRPLKKHAFYIGLILGLMTITRPTDALAFLIPLLWGVRNRKDFRDKLHFLFKTHYSHLLLLCFGGLIFVLPQLLYWKLYAGEFLHYSYKNPREKFEFLHPNTFNFLFSFRKGWFIYTPIMLIAITGIIFAWRKKTAYGLAFLLFTVISIYVLSSWTCWWYATSFSQRSMVQSYPIYLIALGFLLNHLFIHFKTSTMIVSFFIVCFVGLNQFQTWQINHGILDFSRMTKDFYVATFAQTEKNWGTDTLLLINHDVSYINEMPRKWRYEITESHYAKRKPDSANVHILKHTPYPELEVRFSVPDMKNEMHAWYNVSFEYKLIQPADSLQAFVIETMVDEHGEGYSWQHFLMKPGAKPIGNGWFRFENYYLSPVRVFENDKFLTSVDYLGTGIILVRKMKVNVYTEKPGL